MALAKQERKKITDAVQLIDLYIRPSKFKDCAMWKIRWNKKEHACSRYAISCQLLSGTTYAAFVKIAAVSGATDASTTPFGAGIFLYCLSVSTTYGMTNVSADQPQRTSKCS